MTIGVKVLIAIAILIFVYLWNRFVIPKFIFTVSDFIKEKDEDKPWEMNKVEKRFYLIFIIFFWLVGLVFSFGLVFG